jgi:opacity protein-like surface antigen
LVEFPAAFNLTWSLIVKISIIAALFAITAPAYAQNDCIENLEGKVVCGDEADAVRERIRTEVVARQGGGDDFKQSRTTFRSGSAYSGFRNAAFVRGGYIFAARGGGATSGESAPSIAAGFRFKTYQQGNSVISSETEVLYARDSDTVDLLGTPVDATLWGVAGLTGFRWDYRTGVIVSPFASVGVGPAYFRGKLDDGLTVISDGDWTFAYSGRAGVTLDISESVSLETAYRYVGTTQAGTPGLHSGELGLNLKF